MELPRVAVPSTSRFRADSDRAGGAGDAPPALAPGVLAEWAEIAAGGDAALFRERLAWEGFTERDARLAEEPDEGAPATWADTLAHALAHAEATRPSTAVAPDADPLDEVVALLVRFGLDLIRPAAGPHLEPDALDDLGAELARTLRGTLRKPVEASIAVDRALGVGRRPAPDRLRRLAEQFPVAGRLAARTVERWADDNRQLLADYAADAAEIARTFGDGATGGIARIETGLSDPHGGGRTVKIVALSSGERVVYKPRLVGVEVAFQGLIDWMNGAGLSRPLRPLAMLARPHHAWVEFVEHDGVSEEADNSDLYHRAGSLLCLAYVLRGTDFHHENVLVSGGHPVLVDLEMLLQPDLERAVPASARRAVAERLEASVLETNLLPNYHLDLRGVMRGGGGFAWGLVPGAALDRPGAEAPATVGERLLRAHAADVVAGFTEAYDILRAHRAELVGPGGALRAFGGQPVRFLFRPTRVYERLRTRASQADRLRSEDSRRLAFESLFLSPLRDGRRELLPALRAERDALDDMDIPVFYASTDSADLDTGRGVIRGLFSRPSFEAVLDRVEALSDADLAWQTRLIEASIGAMPGPRVREASLPAVAEVPALPPEGLEAVAFDLADGLVERAARDAEGGLCWVARVRQGRDRYRVQAIPNALFDGAAGVALFLAACGALGHEPARRAALAALRPVRRVLESPGIGRRIEAQFTAGAASGLPSVVYALTRIAALLDEPALLDDAGRALSLLGPDAAAGSVDVYDGAAGLVLGVAPYVEATGDAHARSLAVEAGRVILEARDADTRAWRTLDGRCYTGFAHGASGIAAALLRLNDLAPDDALVEAARAGFAYERSLFDPDLGDWLDVPDEPHGSGRPLRAWCHGAAGIGLARVDALRRGLDALPAAELRADVEQALGVVDPDEIGPGDHVCCGAFGRIELLHEAERAGLADPGLAARVASAAVGRRRALGGFALGAGEWLSPGFFQGTSGIGYTLLRLAHPGRFPNALLWE